MSELNPRQREAAEFKEGIAALLPRGHAVVPGARI